jgi:hypothetical protein
MCSRNPSSLSEREGRFVLECAEYRDQPRGGLTERNAATYIEDLPTRS